MGGSYPRGERKEAPDATPVSDPPQPRRTRPPPQPDPRRYRPRAPAHPCPCPARSPTRACATSRSPRPSVCTSAPSSACASGPPVKASPPPWSSVPVPVAAQTQRPPACPPDRRSLHHPTGRRRALVDAPVGRAPGRTGGHRRHLRRDRPARVKKNDLKPWRIQQWCIPTRHRCLRRPDGRHPRSVRRSRSIRDYPVVRLDETPLALTSYARDPHPAASGRLAKVDYEFIRHGRCNLLGLFQPLTGWREVRVVERQTKLTFAEQLRHLVEDLFPEARTIRVVLDNASTHQKSALYEAFPAEQARAIAASGSSCSLPRRMGVG